LPLLNNSHCIFELVLKADNEKLGVNPFVTTHSSTDAVQLALKVGLPRTPNLLTGLDRYINNISIRVHGG